MFSHHCPITISWNNMHIGFHSLNSFLSFVSLMNSRFASYHRRECRRFSIHSQAFYFTHRVLFHKKKEHLCQNVVLAISEQWSEKDVEKLSYETLRRTLALALQH